MSETFTVWRRGEDKPRLTFGADDMDSAIDEFLEVGVTSAAPDIDCVANWCTFIFDEQGDGAIVEWQIVENGHNPQPWSDQ